MGKIGKAIGAAAGSAAAGPVGSVAGSIAGDALETAIRDYMGKFTEELVAGKTSRAKKFRRKLVESSGDSGTTPPEALSDDTPPTNKSGGTAPKVISALGKTADIAGNTYNAYHSLLGQAMLAMAQSSISPAAAAMYGNPYATGGIGAALPHQLKGAIVSNITGGINDIAQNTAQKMADEREREQMTDILMKYDPPATFYDAHRKGASYGGLSSGYNNK